MPGEKKMTKSDAARIQSTQARGGGDMSRDGFASRAQSAADRNANQQASSGGGQAGSRGQQGGNK